MEKITISKQDYQELLEAYKVIKNIMSKIIKKEDIYTEDFIESMEEIEEQLNSGNLKEVNTFEDFIN